MQPPHVLDVLPGDDGVIPAHVLQAIPHGRVCVEYLLVGSVEARQPPGLGGVQLALEKLDGAGRELQQLGISRRIESPAGQPNIQEQDEDKGHPRKKHLPRAGAAPAGSRLSGTHQPQQPQAGQESHRTEASDLHRLVAPQHRAV